MIGLHCDILHFVCGNLPVGYVEGIVPLYRALMSIALEIGAASYPAYIALPLS